VIIVDNISRRPTPSGATVVIASQDSHRNIRRHANYICNGSDDQNIINTALTDGVNGKVIIADGTYTISNPILPQSNTSIELLGKIILAPPLVSDLATDASTGQANVTVEDATGFQVGQWVAIIDDNCPIQGGSTQTRKIGECTTISQINGNTITLSTNLATRSYTTAANAYLTTYHSAILIDQENNITIDGRGIGEIDYNWEAQSDLEPIIPGSTEEVSAGCCIASKGINTDYNENITLKNLYLHDSDLHNIAFQYTQRSRISNCRLDAAHDKNILVYHANNLVIENNLLTNAVFEDGIIFYSGGTNSRLINNTYSNNARSNLYLNSTAQNVACIGDHMSEGLVDGYMMILKGKNINIISPQIWNGLEAKAGMYIVGSNITINGGYIDMGTGNTYGKAIYLLTNGSDIATNVKIRDLTLQNNKLGVHALSGISDCKMVDCTFTSNTTDVTDNSGGELTIV
jgi:hypothetical protein